MMINQILRWLMQPKVWRFVCFASSVVGLVCYALSSSLNHLLGKWTWWKILVYIVFSFFICVTFLFTTARQRCNSLWLETHLAFLVLIITCVYSFFYDKMVNGKPNAYSLVSCASFAIMSLGFSRLTQCGFEIDLLYFFCGGLTVQLMKIKLWLVIAGGGFSYFLIILRSSLDTPRQHLQPIVQNQVIIRIDEEEEEEEEVNADDDESTQSTPPENRDEHVVTQSSSHSQEGNIDDGLIRQQLMDFIKALEKVNQMVVLMVSSHVYKYLKANVDSESKDKDQIQVPQLDPDVNLVMDTLPSGIITRLRETVKLMMDAGFEEECCDVYSNWRREFLEQCLTALGLQLQALNNDVEKWIKAYEATVKILFPNERRLCDSVFSGFSSAADVSFTKVCKELTIRLLSFADTIMTTGSNSLNLVFSIISKFSESLHELNLQLDSETFVPDGMLFDADVKVVRKRLDILMEFANLSYRNTMQATVDDGGTHPITRQVMNYIHHICASFGNTMVPGREGNSSFSVQIAKTIKLLESILEAKSRNYADPVLGYVFMMNNLTYIRQEAYNLEAVANMTILDHDWFRNNIAKLEQNCKLYQSGSWNKMLEFLKLERNESVAPNVVAESMKDKLNLFNHHFEEICNVQSTWIVSDRQLREQIIKSIESILLPAYGKFTDRFHDVFGKHAYEYIEYGIVDIQNYLSNLFLLSE